MSRIHASGAAALAAILLLGGAARAQDGKTLFAKNCAACHQAKGQGIAGAFPALAGNSFVQGAPLEVATVLLKGRGGMPDFSSSLNDGDIAQVLSFVRSSWGNGAPAISEQEVGAQRVALGVPPANGGRLANKH
jgi:cytochrome c6